MFFESEHEESALNQEMRLRELLGQPLTVIDAWRDPSFPPNAKPLFKTERDIDLWIAKQRR